MLRKNNTLGDLSAAVTGLLIAMVSPVTTPYWILLIGDFFAIVVVKQLFGGVGKNFLNPALAARAFMLSWAGEMTTWVGPKTSVPLMGVIDAETFPTPMSYLVLAQQQAVEQLKGAASRHAYRRRRQGPGAEVIHREGQREHQGDEDLPHDVARAVLGADVGGGGTDEVQGFIIHGVSPPSFSRPRQPWRRLWRCSASTPAAA